MTGPEKRGYKTVSTRNDYNDDYTFSSKFKKVLLIIYWNFANFKKFVLRVEQNYNNLVIEIYNQRIYTQIGMSAEQ